MAVFGAKNPHTQFTVVGGVTNYEALSPERLSEFRNLWQETKKFVDEVYIPDLLAVASYYKDWAQYGGCTNFITFGEFPEKANDLASRFMPQGVIFNRDLSKIEDFDPKEIYEHVKYSWYEATRPDILMKVRPNLTIPAWKTRINTPG